MTDKTCTDCGQTLPLTSDHFRQTKAGSWDSRCIPCRKRTRRDKKARAAARNMRDMERGACAEFAKAARRGGENIPHSSEVLERLMEYFGGSSGFAAMMVKQYFDAPPGGAHRTKLLENIVRLVTKNTELGGAKKPLMQWTDEEIEGELDARLQRIAASHEGRYLDAAPQTPTDFALAFGQAIGGFSTIRIAGDAGGIGQPPDRSIEAVPPDTAAGADPSVPSE